MNHFLNILDGFASILDFNMKPGRTYIVRKNGFYVDNRHLRGDVVTVGVNLNKAVKTYGKQSSSSARNK